jgi:two-component system response regulator
MSFQMSTAKTALQVLLVEDNDEDLDLTLRALQKRDLTAPVQVARDGAEALDFLFGTGPHAGRNTAEQPRVVLLDFKLSRAGLEVLKAVKADARTRGIPVVMLSSSALAEDMKAAYALGANSYIVKPVDFDQFTQVIANVELYWQVHNSLPRS